MASNADASAAPLRDLLVGESRDGVPLNQHRHVGLVVGVVVLRRGLIAPLLLPVGGDLVVNSVVGPSLSMGRRLGERP